MNKLPFDLVFVLCDDDAENIARLTSMLQGVTPTTIFAVTQRESGFRKLVEAVADTQRWQSIALTPDDYLGGISRALCLAENNVMLSLPYGHMEADGCQRLLEALQRHPHAALLLPSAVTPTFDFVAANISKLPDALEVSVVDVPVGLFRVDVLRIAGGFDTTLGTIENAWADWVMRAQRLGFAAMRMPRAAVATLPLYSPSKPSQDLLSQRHPSFSRQHLRAVVDVGARLAQSCVQGQHALRVCLDLRYLPEDGINGTGVYAVQLCKALRDYTPARLILLVRTVSQRQALEPLGLPCYLEGQQLPAFHVIHRPAQVFDDRDLLLLLQTDAPFVVTFQDVLAYRAPSVFPNGEEHERYRLLTHLTVRSAQRVIAISEHNRKDLLETLHVPSEHIDVVHHGVHASWFADKDETRNQDQLQSNKISASFFLYVGSDYAHKNLRTLLAAYAQYRLRYGDSERAPALVMVGHPSGTLDGAYTYLRNGAVAGVCYLGNVSDDMLRSLYQSAIALIYPSTYEDFGIPLLEAMAAGCLVVSSTYTSLPEVGADAVYYVSPMGDDTLATALEDLTSNAENGMRLVERGRKRVAKFTWRATAEQSYAVYEKALSEPSVVSLHERRMALHVAERLLAPAHNEHLQRQLARQALAAGREA